MKRDVWWRPLAVLVLGAILTGCAGSQAYKEGQALLAEGRFEAGLAKLDEAVKLDPRNSEYRIGLSNSRASLIGRWISAGESARREGRLADAEQAYRQVQSLDPENAMARQGIHALIADRRHGQLIAQAESLFKSGAPADLNEALERLRPVFTENPHQKDALNLKARIDDVRVKEARPEARLSATFRKPISLEFRDAPLKSVLEFVASVSGLNFFYDQDIRPELRVTVLAKNTSIEDAMRLLLVTNQLEQKVLNENSILIYPATPQKIKDYRTLAVRSFYLTNADVKAVSSTLKTIVKTQDLVTDERLGIIIMRDTPEAIRMAERIVALQDLSDPEVMLEVEILELKRSRLLELGVQWPNQLVLSPLQVGTTPLTLSQLKGLDASTIKAEISNMVISARRDDQDANILANPRIRVRNKDKAKIQIGDKVPAITTTSTSTGFISESVNYVDVGLKLEVEPTIYLDDEIAIKVNLEVSNLVREILSKSGTLSYQIGTRGASTVLRLKDGETQILAGLISDEDRSTANKVPLLGELPVAGRLFGSRKDDRQRSEILLSITPRIVRAIRRPDMLSVEFDSGTETSIGAPSVKLSPAVVAAPSVTPQAEAGVSGAVVAERPVLSWQAPAQVKVGEPFSALLQISSSQELHGMPLLLAYDPSMFEVVDVQEADFFKQGGAPSTFVHKVDVASGKVFVALTRQATADARTRSIGTGGLVTLNLKALKPADSARIQLLSAVPEPDSAGIVKLPVEHLLTVLP